MFTRLRSLYALVCYLLLLQLGACAKRASSPPAVGPTAANSASTSAGAPAPASAGAPSSGAYWDHSAAKVPVTLDDPIWGQTNAPVTIVEFTDYQCPFCNRVTQTLEQIRSKYGPRQVRIVTLHNPLPFHSQAYPAAIAATAVFQLAGSSAFYQFTHLAFENQANLQDESYAKWASACGIDEATFRKALASERAKRKVDADMALAKQLGVSGVPSFRINGVTLSGAQPFDKFASVIDEQLAEAKRLVGSGTAPNDVYVTLTNKNAEVVADAPAPKPTAVEDDTSVYRVPVLPDDPVLGSPGARVTIVVFSDFQCPFCKRVEPTLKQIREHYGNNVRFVWKDLPLPFHPQAMPAAILGRLVYAQSGNQGFWALHDELFDSQPDLGNDKLEALARKHRVSFSRVQAELSGGKVKARIEASSQMADDYNTRGTPNFFINGVRLSGAQPYEKFQQRIDAELEKAKALEGLGVQPAKLYEQLTKIGKGPRSLAEAKAKPIPEAVKSTPARTVFQEPPASATRTESGLAYFVLRKGSGTQHPDDSSNLKVHYSGWTTDGKLFDSSLTRAQPFTFHLNQVIRGWTEGVKLMVVGEKTRFWIPPELAYGVDPRPGVPAGALVFDIELLAIE